MAEVFRAAAATESGTEALVIHCSSARFQQQMHVFLVDGLRLQKYSLLAVPGGVQAFTLLEYLPKFAWAGWRWTKFLVDLEKPQRLIFIGHEECAWYRDMRFWQRQRPTRERVVDDLKQVASEASQRFPQARVEIYYASLAGNEAVFETV